MSPFKPLQNLLRRGAALALSAALTWSVLGAVVQGFQAPPAPAMHRVELPRVVVVARRAAPPLEEASAQAKQEGMTPPSRSTQGKLTHLNEPLLRPAL